MNHNYVNIWATKINYHLSEYTIIGGNGCTCEKAGCSLCVIVYDRSVLPLCVYERDCLLVTNEV